MYSCLSHGVDLLAAARRTDVILYVLLTGGQFTGSIDYPPPPVRTEPLK